MGEVKIDDLMNDVKSSLPPEVIVKDISFFGSALKNTYTITIVSEINLEEHKTILDLIDINAAREGRSLDTYLELVFEDILNKRTIKTK